MSLDDFSLTLLSNVRSDKNNSPSLYITELAKPLNLVGQWEVALMSASYRHDWFNVHQDHQYAIIMPKKPIARQPTNQIRLPDPMNVEEQIVATFEAQEGSSSNNEFETAFNSLNIKDRWRFKLETFASGEYLDESKIPLQVATALWKLYQSIHLTPHRINTESFIKYNSNRHRVTLYGGATSFIILAPVNNSIIHLLGFGAKAQRFKSPAGVEYEYLHVPKENPALGMEAESPIQRRTISHLFIYSDIVEQSLIGDAQANLLGFFPIKTHYGDDEQWYFANPISRPVKMHDISSIKIELRQATGDLMPMSEGVTSCELSFHRKSPYR